MYKTDNYNLTVTELTDAPPDITELSANFPLIDAILKDHEDLFGSYVPLTSVKSKGNETTPIYFDANGVAKTITSYGGTSARATADGSGNVLTSFYEPKQNLSSKGNATTPVYIDADGVAQETNSFDDYIPLSGGMLKDWASLRMTTNNSKLIVSGGASTSINNGTGARLALCGNNTGDDDAGAFTLIASIGQNQGWLRGEANGTLSWNNEEIERIHSGSSGLIRYSSGIQICSAVLVGANPKTISYSAPFISTPALCIMVAHPQGDIANTFYSMTAYNCSKTGFTAQAWQNGVKTSGSLGWAYIAVGNWK